MTDKERQIPSGERLFKIAYGSEAHSEEIEEMALALLARIDVKPVAWQWFYYKQWHVTNDPERAKEVAKGGDVEVTPLYTTPPAASQVPDTCQWSYDDVDYKWDSACGESWQFMDGGPEDNSVNFCQGCGKPVVIASPSPSADGE